jgi:uncharacterized protein YbjT (DUF2867 family)
VQPGRCERLQVAVVSVEGEGLLDWHLNPLASLEQVYAHPPSFAGGLGRKAGLPVPPGRYRREMAASTLIAGATGFVGSRLAETLHGSTASIRCLVRDRSKARRLAAAGLELHVGDIADARSLEGAGEGVEVAYYLVHAMAGGGGFAERERDGARNFAQMAKREGVKRVIYLGGPGDESESEHLRSRHETARVLAAEGPPLTYFRAAMVVGADSESFRTLRYLVDRLPMMIAPGWLRTPTQPIGIDAVISYLRRAPEVPESEGREVQIGGPDVLSYSEMLDRMAVVLGKAPRRKIPVPLITPWLSALWLGLVTPVDTKVARPLVEGLTTATVVTDPSGAEPFGISPESFDEALRRALADEGS